MIALPEAVALLDVVQDSMDTLSALAKQETLADRDWFVRLASNLSQKLQSPGLKIYAGRNAENVAMRSGPEWLFDFCALAVDEGSYMGQAALVGEVEWSYRPGEIERDFEKLLIVDSVACFFAFQHETIAKCDEYLGKLEMAVLHHHAYSRKRGMAQPTAFLLSAFSLEGDRATHHFRHRRVLPELR